jgi:WhiB family redox-sensing transcriptional regulator
MNEMNLYLKLQKAIEESPVVVPCQNTDPEIWFGDREDGYHYARLARELCGLCPARQACAEYAIASNEPHGFWGGLSPKERQAIRNRGRGRPRAA